MDNKKRMIRFLERIAKECDTEATAMIDMAKAKGMDNQMSAFVYSSSIMNVYTFCKLIIDKANSTTGDKSP